MPSLTELLEQLDPDNTVRRGTQFERICQWFLTHDPSYASELEQVWLWDDWPDRWGSDAGIDLVAKGRDGKLWAIQAKAYSETTSITKRDIDTFISESARSVFSFRLLIATTNQLGATAKRTLDAQEKQSAVLLRGDLEASRLDWPTSPDHLHARPVAGKRPRPHQRSAIDAVLNAFNEGGDRGQLIMACGTGKTLTSVFIADELGTERALVLVPSLALLAQTLREWAANSSSEFASLAVCSDDTVVSRDTAATTVSDLGRPVTTEPAEIAAFLRGSGRRVVFTTYQSSPQVAKALELAGVPAFDLAVADEAHRCAGRSSTEFATVLDDGLIRARRRLFMTATPRFFTGGVVREGHEAEFEIASMDDHAKFGPVFHRLGFSEAISDGLLTDYRVVVVGVDNATYRSWAEHGRFVTTDGVKVTDARTLASQIGLAKAMHRYDLRRTISFHSRVNRAREFAANLPAVIDWMPPEQRPTGKVWAAHASGDMSTGKRHALLQKLSDLYDCDRALMTNARCLNEGIDVPALDGVAFIDPRQSEVDIVQAVGRAIRRVEDKTLGTIVIPVFVDSEQDPETTLNESSFKPVWNVIQALRSHDDTLAETLDHLRHELGKRSGPGSIQLPSKIVVDLPTTVSGEFAEAFNVRLVEKTTSTWELWLALLEQFIEREGHALVPATYTTDGHALGSWVATQRHKRATGRLTVARVQRLDAVPGWTWDALTAQWEEGFARLVTFVSEHGHARVPQSFTVDEYKLGTWVTIQRTNYAAGRGLPDREARLRNLPGWSWDPRSDQWEARFEHLVGFTEAHEHSRVPKDYTVDGCGLGGWVQIQRSRYNKGILEPVRADRLQALRGWTWTPDADQWDKFFALLVTYVDKHGHPRVPQTYVLDGHRLGSWLSNQRHSLAKGTLSADRAKRLTTLPGWTAIDPWEQAFTLLGNYAKEHGHTRVPKGYTVGHDRLGNWVAKQRDKYSAATLAVDKIERLNTMPGWTWDPYADSWEDSFRLLEEYAQANGHAAVPRPYTVNGSRLGQWVGVQRSSFSKGRLAAGRAARLEALPMWSWDPASDRWEAGFVQLTGFVGEHRHAQVPKSYVDESGFPLGSWAATQRNRRARGTLPVDQERRLNHLPGWVWDIRIDQWEQGFRHLTAYVDQHGHARVSSGHVDHAGYRLGQWCKVQRRNRNLSAERRRRLEALRDWTWDAVADQWGQGFRHLTAYVDQHGHARVPDAFQSEDKFRLGQWVGVQRRAQSTGSLSTDRQRRLTTLPGWTWNPVADQWEHGFAVLTIFAEENGHARVPSECLAGDFPVGQWVLTQRARYASGRIPDEQIQRLEELAGWSWDTLADQWEASLARLIDYVTEHGHALVHQDHVDQTGFRLGTWVATQRSRYTKGILDAARVRRIEQSVPGWSWDPHTDRWEQGFQHLTTYVEKHGHARVPRAYEVDGYRLGGWCKTQRTARAKDSLSIERYERLNSLTGWAWDANAESWQQGLAQLIAFVDQHGHARIPRDCIVDGYPLGNWASNQRAARARGALSAARMKRIEEAVPGWSWAALSDRWAEGFARLLAYTAAHGHALIPQSYVDQTGFRLGTWVATQRTRYTNNALSTDRIERLESVDGWAWKA
ncbi:DEAD/DEAH box helicase [Nocardia camponoti]|uniref:Helicase n=1 Tax=Nocardia camponoti TaxID=1616106 RepID=A0A917Q7P0_9NOCA|nr:DEAD/DEAH box helicase [Nocardia camponoti]GGK33993.1 hypothetical protein GCM10011591_02070 [Nocardia camponoti]